MLPESQNLMYSSFYCLVMIWSVAMFTFLKFAKEARREAGNKVNSTIHKVGDLVLPTNLMILNPLVSMVTLVKVLICMQF